MLIEKFPSFALSPPVNASDPDTYRETLQIWDLQSLTHRCTLFGHTGDVRYSDLSRDGQFAASASTDGTLRVWRTSDCSEISRISREGDYWTGLRFSPDSRLLTYIDAYDEPETAKSYAALIDISQNFVEIDRWEIDRVYLAGFSSDSRILALVTANGEVYVVNIVNGAVRTYILELAPGDLPGDIWFGRDSHFLFVQVYSSILVLLINETLDPVVYREAIRIFVGPHQYTHIGVIMTKSGQVQATDLTSGQTLATLPPRQVTGPYRGIDSSDKIIVTIKPAFINLYDVINGSLLRQLPHENVSNVMFSEDNRLLLSWSSGDSRMIMWGVPYGIFSATTQLG